MGDLNLDPVTQLNKAGTPWFADDLALCRHPGVASVMLPKADGIDAVRAVVETSFKDVLARIESARGIEAVRAIARVPGVVRLAFGSVDLALDLGIDCDPDGREKELLHSRSQLTMAPMLGITARCRAASLQRIDGKGKT